jgi:hypothetical protein
MLDARKRRAFASARPSAAMQTWVSRPYGRGRKTLVLYEARRVPISQIYGLIAYERELSHRYDATIRFAPNHWLESGLPRRLAGAEVVVLQSWLTDSENRLPRLIDAIETTCPGARIVYFDGFANSDIRVARHLEGRVAAYGKKGLLRNTEDLVRVTNGDTVAAEFYGKLYGLDLGPVDWQVPRGILPRLRLTPGFFTAPQMIDLFRYGPEPDYAADRPIDIHARLASDGNPRYATMREDSVRRVDALTDVTVARGTGIPWADYIREMHQSKLCFSPFGYGELCWRDVEAYLTGSVLIKPDMSHMRTQPELFVPEETYVPCAWDFSDLEPVVRGLLSDPDRRHRIARTAFRMVRDYLNSDGPLIDYGFIFEDRQ